MSHLGVNKEATEQRVPSGLLEVTFQMFYGCHHDLDNRYGLSLSQMTSDMFRNHNLIISSFVTFDQNCKKSNITGATSGAENDCPSGALEFTPKL